MMSTPGLGMVFQAFALVSALDGDLFYESTYTQAVAPPDRKIQKGALGLKNA